MSQNGKNIIEVDEFLKLNQDFANFPTQERFCLIVGNGINLYWKGINKSLQDREELGKKNNWSSLLSNFMKTNAKQLNLSDEESRLLKSSQLTDTERAQFLYQRTRGTGVDFYRGISEEIDRMYRINFQSVGDCALLDSCWANQHHILTTNFDSNIERYFLEKNVCDSFTKQNIPYPKGKGSETNQNNSAADKNFKDKKTRGEKSKSIWGAQQHYDWNCFVSPEEKDVNSSQEACHDIWHIHGMISAQRNRTYPSVLFSFGSYTNAISTARKYGDINLSNSRIAKTWLSLFIKCPLIFVGIGLSDQEIFLRNLLLVRQRYRYYNPLVGGDNSFYFFSDDLEKKSRNNCPGNDFLALQGIKSVRFDTLEQMYNFKLN